jgi:methionyl-tRNA synthetase
MEPGIFCDQMAAKFKSTWAALHISYDTFIRTTEERHTLVVQDLFQKMLDNGDIYKGTYTALYCEGCEDFKFAKDLDTNGNCPNHLKPPKKVTEENYFFRLSSYKEALKKWLSSEPIVFPEARRKELMNQLNDEDFGDFSVSRSRASLAWGIPVPGDPNQVIYVWVDALSNYVTGCGYLTNDEQYKRYWPADLHLIGKDITKFHALYWPAMLMSAGLPVPKSIAAHGFLTVEGQKISKSLGNVIDPNALVDQYGPDALRYYLFAVTQFDQDGNFSKHEFINRVNADLANNLGNLLNRTLTLLERNCNGTVPEATLDKSLHEQADQVYKTVDELMGRYEFARAIETTLSLIDQANKYMNDEKPWVLFKDGNTVAGATVLYAVLEILRRAALCLFPFIPNLSNAIWKQLGYKGKIEEIADYEQAFSSLIPPGQKVENTGPIFARIEEAAVSVEA